ncbi:hypothetical protein EDB89DRAFT_2063198 [Lactarius sanguifluus]|nr:hypothetical protein EDB89DRAFT_2063198 [Lactarius sanguifluus]
MAGRVVATLHASGKMISELEWKLIHQAAFTIAHSHLVPLQCDIRAIPGKMHKKTTLKGNFLNEWLDAVTVLKCLCPLLSLCTGNWKGDMVLGSSRLVIPSPSFQPRHLFFPHGGFLPFHSLQSPHPQPHAPAQSPQESELASKTSSKAKHRRDPSPPRQNGKRSKANVGASGTSTASNPVQRTPSPHPAFMLMVQSGTASQSTLSAEAAAPKTLQSKQDHATSRAKAPSTWAAKAKGNRAVMTDNNNSNNNNNNNNNNDNDVDMATQPVSGSHPVTPIKDPRCQSPKWGTQVQVRMATSSFENSSEPAPPKMTRSKQDHATSRTKVLSTQTAKAKANHAMVTDSNDDDMATQPVSGSRPVTPVDNPMCQSPKWGTQVQVRMVTSSFENLSQPAPPMTTRFKQDHARTQSAKAKDSRSATDDNDVAAQSQSKSRLVTPTEDPGHKSPDQARMVPSSEHSDDNESHSHLQVLLHDELKQWVDDHKLESQGKWLTRIGLIKAIAGAPKSAQPSKEDIESIVNERKSRRNTKAA